MTVHVGSDEQRTIDPPGFAAGRRSPSHPAPAGRLHAVVDGTEVARCGHRPTYLFLRLPFPAEGADRCPGCLTG